MCSWRQQHAESGRVDWHEEVQQTLTAVRHELTRRGWR
jgi:hypothetical protein